ncbi:MAG: baseplate J/gp47 family protein [Sphingomonadaceae bacterium]
MPPWGREAITLDSSDTLHSALAKLELPCDGAAVVVLAPGCTIAENPVTYRLLARASARIGVPMAVVSGNPGWRRMAREHGLHAYPSQGALRRARRRSAIATPEAWADSLVSTLHPSSLRQVWPVAAVVVLLLGAFAFFGLPVMRITLRAPAQTLTQEATVKVDIGTVTVDAASMSIPGRAIEHRFTVSDFVETTGEKKVGKERAKGEVTIINSGAATVTLPAGTTLFTDGGVRFTTVASAIVPPYTQPTGASTRGAGFPAGTEGGVKVAVVAAEPGAKGNVPALSISRIEGDAYRGLTVVNEQPLTGGTDENKKSISAEDRTRLKEALFQRAQSQSLSELTVRVRQSESIIPHSMQVQIAGEEYDKAQDEEGDRLKGTAYVVASGMAFANQDLNSVVERSWKESIPKGYRALPGNLSVSPPEVVEAAGRTATLKVRVSGQAEPLMEIDKLTEALRGVPLSDARAKLSNLEGGFKLMSIEMWPGWATRAFRIEVQTVQ